MKEGGGKGGGGGDGGGVDPRPRLTFLSLNEPPAAALDSRRRLCLRALRNM